MEQAYKLATNYKYSEATKLIDDVIEEINVKLKNNINEEIKLLLKDFDDVKNRCKPVEWDITGSKTMSNCMTRYMTQSSNIQSSINPL